MLDGKYIEPEKYPINSEKSNNSFELSLGKFLDQKRSVSSLSIVFEPSVSIKLNKRSTFSFIDLGSYIKIIKIVIKTWNTLT